MLRFAALVYGLVAYAFFFVTILYAIGFVGNLVVPKGIDDGPVEPLGRAVAINLAMLAAFGVQHSTMARPAFKAWWTRMVPVVIERSSFVLITSVILLITFWQWRPMPTTIWRVEAGWAAHFITGASMVGWALVFYSSFLIDHFDLFGLRQVWFYFRGQPYTHPVFMERSIYRRVRHPLMLGFLIAFWFTPHMTAGHLLFAGVTTLYILVAVQIEERDLLRFLGEDYRAYRRRTPMLIPWRSGRAKA